MDTRSDFEEIAVKRVFIALAAEPKTFS